MGVAYALNTPPPLPRFHPPREERIHPVKNTKPELKSDLQTQSCHAFVTLIPQCTSISSLYQLFLFCSHANNFQPIFSKPTFIFWQFRLRYVNHQLKSVLRFHFRVYIYVAYIIHISCTKIKVGSQYFPV